MSNALSAKQPWGAGTNTEGGRCEITLREVAHTKAKGRVMPSQCKNAGATRSQTEAIEEHIPTEDTELRETSIVSGHLVLILSDSCRTLLKV